MNIITVIPISRSKIASELTYFTAINTPVGSIVTVPLRSKKIHAIVTKIESALDLKSAIKDAPFKIRKLEGIKTTIFFPASFIDSCKYLAEYYATTIGAIIYTLIDAGLLENVNRIPPPLPAQASFLLNNPEEVNSKEETFRVIPPVMTLRPKKIMLPVAVQGDDVDRISSWRSLIREEFAKKKSVAIYVPTVEDCDRIYSELEKGIEGYIWKINGSFTNKKIIDTWIKISEIDHPIVVIATGSFSLLPRGDIKTIIIERENSRGWISARMPYLDIRNALETIGLNQDLKVYIADSMLRTETLYRLEQGKIDEGAPFKWRSISTAHDSLINMRDGISTNDKIIETKADKITLASGKIIGTDSTYYRFRVLSRQLETSINTNSEENTHLFILTLRRGLSPMTVCNDCEYIVHCNNCSTPVVLHSSKETGNNFFMCHLCGERRGADEVCAKCGSWRLTPLGIGIDLVHEEIKKKFPNIDVFKIDTDTTKNAKQIKDVIEKFKSKPGSILLGTELAVQYLSDHIEHIAIASIDTLFSLPDFRIQEKIMHMLIRLRAQATRSFLVQTRQHEEKVFEYGLKGNLSDYFRKSIIERKEFMYPPFYILIKITIEGKKNEIAEIMAEIENKLTPAKLDIFPAFTSTIRGKSIIHGLMRIVAHAWPDPDIISKLRALPPNVSVKINPESLL